MSSSEISALCPIIPSDSSADAVETGLEKVREYFNTRVDEIKKRVLGGKRSIFDFIDMAVVIGALAHVTNTQGQKDGDRYIEFFKNEFIAPGEANMELVATASYCLMRCGLVHELSLRGHNLKSPKKEIIGDYTISATHDRSPTGACYTVEQGKKEIVLYAHELLEKIEECLAKCFDGKSTLWNAVRTTVLAPNGIRIIQVIK